MVDYKNIRIKITPDYRVVVEVGGKSADTYLSQFINRHTEHYVEPQRKGTSKGDQVGFSTVKHMASYLMIVAFTEREIADMLNMSVGVLRNWLTETTFKDAVQDNCKRFAEYFGSDMISKIEYHREMPIFHEGRRTMRRGSNVVKNDFKELCDSHLYSDCVADNVLAMMLRRLTTLVKDPEMYEHERTLEEIQSTLLLFSILIDYLFSPEAAHTKLEYYLIEAKGQKILRDTSTIKHLLGAVTNILSKHPVSKRDKCHIRTIISAVESYLGSFVD